MRNEKRIKPFLNILKSVWEQNPDWTFVQLLEEIDIIPKEYVSEGGSVTFEADPLFLEKLQKIWEEYPDWRFTQLLVNTGTIPNIEGFWYYKEESDFFKGQRNEFMFWGSYGKDGRGPRRDIAIKDMDTDHIMACLKTQPNMMKSYREEMSAELKRRKIEEAR